MLLFLGRASASPTIDLLITLLSLGWHGYQDLLKKRKEQYTYLREKLSVCAERHGEKLLEIPHNPISMGKESLHFFTVLDISLFMCVSLAQRLTCLHCNLKVPSSIPAGSKDLL